MQKKITGCLLSRRKRWLGCSCWRCNTQKQAVWEHLLKQKICLPFGSVPLLGLSPIDMKPQIHKNLYRGIVITVTAVEAAARDRTCVWWPWMAALFWFILVHSYPGIIGNHWKEESLAIPVGWVGLLWSILDGKGKMQRCVHNTIFLLNHGKLHIHLHIHILCDISLSHFTIWAGGRRASDMFRVVNIVFF